MPTLFDHDPETGELRDTPKPNIGEYSVTSLSQALKRTIEDGFGHVRVRGEITGFKGPHSSGHCYFSLKDEGAKLDAVMWKMTYARLRSKLRDGLEVIATGKITSYPGKSTYQIIVEQLEPAGEGALMALIEERRLKLLAEGLFDQSRKKPIPFLPRLIGIVTSPTGAVIRDILHRLADRYPRDVLVWPVRVQGDTCAAEVAQAIDGFNRMTHPPDLIIVARGGGSLEDLWGFNEEIVVRAAARSLIPLISAVGHETDTTLIDFAADHRAPTPTAAAERAVPVRADLLSQVASLAARHRRSMSRALLERKTRVRAAARALPRPEDLMALARQRHDTAAGRLTQALRANTEFHRSRLSRTSARLSLSPLRNQLRTNRQRLDTAWLQAGKAAIRFLDRRTDRIASSAKLLATLSYKSVLARGFALVRDEQGGPVRSRAEVAPGQTLAIEFADGQVGVRETGALRQGSLF